jgi:hypothetical protein
MTRLVAPLLLVPTLAGGAAAAQSPGPILVCFSREEIETALAGEPPAGCHSVEVTVVETPSGAACAVGVGEVAGLAGALAGDAIPESVWIDCAVIGGGG